MSEEMDVVFEYKKAVDDTDSKLKDILVSYIKTDYLEKIGHAAAYLGLDNKNVKEALLKFSEEERKVIAENAEKNKTDADVMSDVSWILNTSEKIGDQEINNLLQMHCAMKTKEIENVISEIDDSNPVLASVIRNNIIRFEDIIYIDDRSLQMLLREIALNVLLYALKGECGEIKEKFFRNMSPHNAQMLKEDLEFSGEVPVEKVTESQERICRIFKRLVDEGKIKNPVIRTESFK